VLADGTALGYAAGAGGVTLRIASAKVRRYEVEMPFGRAPVAVRLDGHTLPRLAASTRAGVLGWRYRKELSSTSACGGAARVLITFQARSGQLSVVGAGFSGQGS
jgi:hypothetical protein